jgi:hypothetical protein
MSAIACLLLLAQTQHQVVSVPKSWKLDPWYTQGVEVLGMRIVGSKNLKPEALLEAAKLTEKMLEKRPFIAEELGKKRIHTAIMAESEVTTDVPEHRRLNELFPKTDWNKRARGLGPGAASMITSAAEENLLRYESDPYSGESIFIHEFAHAIMAYGIPPFDEEFLGNVEAAYKNAMKKGLWKGLYAAQNMHEYWAEGVQSYFDANLESIPSNGIHNHVNTPEELEEYDPELYALIRRYMGATTYRWAKDKR